MTSPLPHPVSVASIGPINASQAVRILVLALQHQVVTLSERVGALEERAQQTSRVLVAAPLVGPAQRAGAPERETVGAPAGRPARASGHGSTAAAARAGGFRLWIPPQQRAVSVGTCCWGRTRSQRGIR